MHFKSVATLGDGCPTLDLTYAHAANLVVNRGGQPIDQQGNVDRSQTIREGCRSSRIATATATSSTTRSSATRASTRCRTPAPRASLDRYAVVIPADVAGPVAVTAAVYYQSIEAIAALKLLGNLADTDLDFRLEPCVLGGRCDGRIPSVRARGGRGLSAGADGSAQPA